MPQQIKRSEYGCDHRQDVVNEPAWHGPGGNVVVIDLVRTRHPFALMLADLSCQFQRSKQDLGPRATTVLFGSTQCRRRAAAPARRFQACAA
ncbi:hypothetical protein, partial [Sphingobium scionense]|uniref:hypothetical protein n=1 Tax=Sphingobium scionense TaxID=1404341 RepID=UPI001CB731D8